MGFYLLKQWSNLNPMYSKARCQPLNHQRSPPAFVSNFWVFFFSCKLNFIFFFHPELLRFNWHIIFCKFKLYNVMNWYVCILWNCYHNKVSLCITLGFPGGSDGEESACSVEEQCLIPELGRSPGGGHGNALQCSCRRIPMDRGSWWATVHGVAKSWTQLSN